MGLDPRIAKQLATATSKEEKLINALDKLTEATYAAAGANVEFEASRTKRLETQAPPGTVVPKGGTALSSEVALDPKARQAEELRRRKEENIAKRKEREKQRGLGIIPGGETVAGGIPGAVPLDQLLSPPPPGTGVGAEAPQRFGGGRPGTQPAPGVPRDELFATGRPQGTQRNPNVDRELDRYFSASPEEKREMEQQGARNVERMYGQGGVQQAMAGPQAPAGDPNATMQNFIGSFASVSDNIIRSFSGIQDSLSQLAQSMAGFTMTHNVTVEGLISIGGLNVEAIKTELSSSIGQVVATKVQEAMNEERKNFRS